MDERMRKNYLRFKAYTRRLAIVMLVAGLICLLLFRSHSWIGVMLLVASISAWGHYAFLKISLSWDDHHRGES